MDENVKRVLQMLQDGQISAPEAETLIAALRGETVAPSKAETGTKSGDEKKGDHAPFGAPIFDKIKPPKIDLDNLGERISKAVSKIEPEKLVKKVQTQLRNATKAGAHWTTTVNQRVRTWTDGEDARPENSAGLPEHTDTQSHEAHLEPAAFVNVENPLGNVKIFASGDGPASVQIRKTVWNARGEDLKGVLDKIEVAISGTDARLEVKVSAPDFFRDGVADLELRLPPNVSARVHTRYGDIEIAGIEGRAEGVTTSGRLLLHDLNGDARGETASGDIALMTIQGSATVATQTGNIQADDIRRGLSANAASGDVNVSGVEGGRVECISVSGDVKVERVGTQAPLDIRVESVSGDAHLADANGNIAVKAVSGDATVTQATATRLHTQTVSGDVSVAVRQAFSGTMQINTVSGDVKVHLPEGSNVRVSLGTTSGDLRCEHDAHNVTANETFWTGQIGTGAGTLNVQTISGDTSIQRA